MEGVSADLVVLGVFGEWVFDVDGAFRMKMFSTIALLVLAGCSPLQSAVDDAGVENVASNSIGRFQFHGASKDLPAYVFDTASGCLSHVAQTETSTKEAHWVELNTKFANWQCPSELTEKIKQGAQKANLK